MANSLVWNLLGGLGISRPESKDEAAEGESGKGDDEPASWVTVLTVYSPVEAQIGAARLSDEGIPVRLRQEAASSAIPVTVGILGQIEVMVPEAQEERAITVLEATMDIEIPEEDDED